MFSHVKTFGSLIQIPPKLAEALPELEAGLSRALASGDMFASAAAKALMPLVRQAKILAMKFDVVVANPPYMGAKYYDGLLKRLVDACYKSAKGDLYTCFMVRNTVFAKTGGMVGMITIPNWMFLSSFEDMREWLFKEVTIETFSHNGLGDIRFRLPKLCFYLSSLCASGIQGMLQAAVREAGKCRLE